MQIEKLQVNLFMYNTKRKAVIFTDYPKAEINLSYITLNLIISIYSYSLNFIFINPYINIFRSDKVSVSVVFMLIITLLLIRYIYNTYKNTNITPLLVFILLLLIVFFLRAYAVFLCIICFIYSFHTCFLWQYA